MGLPARTFQVMCTRKATLLRGSRAVGAFLSPDEPEEVAIVIDCIERGDLDAAQTAIGKMQGGLAWVAWETHAKSIINELQGLKK